MDEIGLDNSSQSTSITTGNSTPNNHVSASNVSVARSFTLSNESQGTSRIFDNAEEFDLLTLSADIAEEFDQLTLSAAEAFKTK
ncbi:15842_t:CDS:1, partial [Racocetra fulgida]